MVRPSLPEQALDDLQKRLARDVPALGAVDVAPQDGKLSNAEWVRAVMSGAFKLRDGKTPNREQLVSLITRINAWDTHPDKLAMEKVRDARGTPSKELEGRYLQEKAAFVAAQQYFVDITNDVELFVAQIRQTKANLVPFENEQARAAEASANTRRNQAEAAAGDNEVMARVRHDIREQLKDRDYVDLLRMDPEFQTFKRDNGKNMRDDQAYEAFLMQQMAPTLAALRGSGVAAVPEATATPEVADPNPARTRAIIDLGKKLGTYDQHAEIPKVGDFAQVLGIAMKAPSADKGLR